VLPPGGDWLQTVAGNVRLLDVRALLMTDDDQRIYMRGRRRPRTVGNNW
jgi:hypothetical protein